MAFFVRPLTLNEETDINNLKTFYPDNTVLQVRLDIILLSNQRYKSGKIAEQLQVGRKMVVRCIQQFNEQNWDYFEQYLSNEFETNLAEQITAENSTLFVHPLTVEEQTVIQNLLETYQSSPHTLKHLQAVKLSSLGLTIPEIASRLGFSQRTFWRVRFWIDQFNNAGIASLETYSDRNWLKHQLRVKNIL